MDGYDVWGFARPFESDRRAILDHQRIHEGEKARQKHEQRMSARISTFRGCRQAARREDDDSWPWSWVPWSYRCGHRAKFKGCLKQFKGLWAAGLVQLTPPKPVRGGGLKPAPQPEPEPTNVLDVSICESLPADTNMVKAGMLVETQLLGGPQCAGAEAKRRKKKKARSMRRAKASSECADVVQRGQSGTEDQENKQQVPQIDSISGVTDTDLTTSTVSNTSQANANAKAKKKKKNMKREHRKARAALGARDVRAGGLVYPEPEGDDFQWHCSVDTSCAMFLEDHAAQKGITLKEYLERYQAWSDSPHRHGVAGVAFFDWIDTIVYMQSYLAKQEAAAAAQAAVTEPEADIAGGGPAGASAAAGAVVMNGSTMSAAEVAAGARVVEGVPLRL